MDNLIIDAEKYVISYLNKNLDSKFVYHNIAHTQRVVEKIKELIEDSDLNEDEKLELLIAAWFHDTGFTRTIENHEDESIKIASSFLKSQMVSAEKIEAITNIIMATKMQFVPQILWEYCCHSVMMDLP